MIKPSVLVFAAILLATVSPAGAQSGTAARAWLAGTGTDSGSCQFSTPCRTLAFAITVVRPGGQILLLDQVGYGTVTITASVSIIAEGHIALVNVPSGNGITINANPSDSVLLRGLTVDGLGGGYNGIVYNTGGALIVEQCDVRNFVGSASSSGNPSIGNGILLLAAAGLINISHTVAENNAYAGVSAGSATAFAGKVAIDNVKADLNGAYGIFLNGTSAALASVSNSTTRQNNTAGLYIQGFKAASVDSVIATENGVYGMLNSNSPLMLLGRSIIAGNATGISTVGGGTTYSYQNNFINGNGQDQNNPLSSATQR